MKKYPLDVRLEFFTETAKNHRFGDTVILYDEVNDYILLKIPKVSKGEIEIINTPETKEEVAIRCIDAETNSNFQLIADAIFIGVKKVNNTHPLLKGLPFFRNVMLATGYQGYIESDGMVWVKRKLLCEIFTSNKSFVPHSQVYAYVAFTRFLERSTMD